MALGKQFEGTYWHDPDSGDVLTNQVASGPVSVYGPNPRPNPVPASTKEGPLQGMLFGPTTGTGRYGDPLVPPERRQAAVHHALGMTPLPDTGKDVEGQYRDNVGFTGAKPSSGSRGTVDDDRADLDVTLLHSGLPTHEMERQPSAKTVVDKRLVGSGYSGYAKYRWDGGVNIHVARGSDEDTLLHEMGHAKDPHGADTHGRMRQSSWVADPMNEGKADAMADRNSRYGNRLESDMSTPEYQLGDVRRNAYTDRNSIWKTDTSKALYAATRLVARESPSSVDRIPSRDALMKTMIPDAWNPDPNPRWGQTNESAEAAQPKQPQNTADKLALGHMWEHNPQMHETLKALGHEDTALRAHEEYQQRQPRAFFDHPGEKYSQLAFRGMRKY